MSFDVSPDVIDIACLHTRERVTTRRRANTRMRASYATGRRAARRRGAIKESTRAVIVRAHFEEYTRRNIPAADAIADAAKSADYLMRQR